MVDALDFAFFDNHFITREKVTPLAVQRGDIFQLEFCRDMVFRVYKFVESERFEVSTQKIPEEKRDQLTVFV